MTVSSPLFERIAKRCRDEDHRYLDLQASGPVVSEGLQLIALAQRIASYMSVHLADHRVVICLDQCSTFMPVFWGCLHAGLTAIPVTMAASGCRANGRELDELRRLLEQSSPVAIVVDELSAGLQNLLPLNADVRWLPFSRLITAEVPPPAAIIASEVAFALQTSGTTGECKYAAFSGDWYDYEVSNPRRVLSLFPLGSSTGIGYAYALSSLSSYLPLCEAVREPDRLLAAIEAYQIEVVVMPPLMVSVLLRYFTAASRPLVRRDLSSLLKLNIGSSAIPLELVDRLGHMLRLWGAPDGVIHFAYGLTETGGVSYGPYRGLTHHHHPYGLKIGPVSSAINVRIDSPSSGEPGSISVQRPFTFLGYLTATSDVRWSLSPFNGGVDWFETGDLGLLEGDELVLAGRQKDTIVLNSRKTSLEAIERFVLDNAPDLFDVVVACAGPDESLVLFVVVSPEAASLPSDQLKATISQPLQRQFGVPLRQLLVRDADDIPRTATGKVRKQDLVASLPDSDSLVADCESEIPADAFVEQQLLAAIRQQSAAFRAMGGGQPISTYGIDSLALAQIIGEVERQSGIRCRLEACPPDPTVQQLSKLFSISAEVGGSSEILPPAVLDQDLSMADVSQFPIRPALAHRIQAANIQLSGESLGPEHVVRRFNSYATGAPVVLVGKLTGTLLMRLANEYPEHPFYYLRVLHDYASPANQDYLVCCYLDWLEACLPECRPVVVGFCLSSRIALDLSRQMWRRRRPPRLCVLIDWNIGRYVSRDPYDGPVVYHVNHRYHNGASEKRRIILDGLQQLTPNVLMTYWSGNRIHQDEDKVSRDETEEVFANIMHHQAVRQILSTD